MPEDTTTVTDPGTETVDVDPAAAETPEPETRPSPRSVARRAAATAAAPAPAQSAEPESADQWADWEWDGKVESLPAPLQKIVKDARAGEAKSRTNAKEQAATEAREAAEAEMVQKFGRMLGLISDDEKVDPSDLEEQLQEHRNNAWASAVELNVHRLAAQLDADPDKLLDSRSFLDTLDDLIDENPRSVDFKTALEERIKAAVEDHPKKYKLAGQEPVAPTPAPASRRPVESLRPGAAPGSGASSDDPNDWLRNRLRNRG